MYDSDYPDLAQIIDDYGNDVLYQFTTSIQARWSTVGRWSSKDYKVYKWSMPTQIPTPVNYKFIHLPS